MEGNSHDSILGYPIYFLKHWGAHADPAKRIDLPTAIRKLARGPAMAVGLEDRGLVAPCIKADINVIDLARLHLEAPRPVYDLPEGGPRLTQLAQGNVATVVSGVVTYRDGHDSGARPGRLVRGAQSIPTPEVATAA